MTNGLQTPLCDFLGIEYPIVLAGMAAGGQSQTTAPTPVRLVAAVTNAGGLGVMGDNFADLDDLDAGIRELRALVQTSRRPASTRFTRTSEWSIPNTSPWSKS